MVALTINGLEIQVAEGTTILEACRMNGIDIPTFCHDEDLKIDGSCRMCVVACQGRPRLLASCCTPADNGMVIETESEVVVEARRVILELLLSRHVLKCNVCDANGSCRLQDYCYRYGVSESSFTEGGAPHYPVTDDNPFIQRDYEKCIMCTRCVRACDEITAARAIGIKNRGHQAQIAAPFADKLEESTCIFCGQCLMVCPVGALSSKVSAACKGKLSDIDTSLLATDCFQLFFPFQKLPRYTYQSVLTTCTHCGTGCTLNLNIKNNHAVGVTSNREENWSPVNKGALCVKGRFGWDFINSPHRLTTPLIKEDGQFRPASWEEALGLVAERLAKIKAEHGPDAFAMFSSPRVTNEENYLAQKFTRGAMGTNNIDQFSSRGRSLAAGLGEAYGSEAMTNAISELEHDAQCILLIGSNTSEDHPVIGMKIKKNVLENGAKLLVADPCRTDMAELAEVYLPFKPGTDAVLVNGLMHVIIKEGLADSRFIENCTEDYAAAAEGLTAYTPEAVAEITGVPAGDIIKAARIYGQSAAAAICYPMGGAQAGPVSDDGRSLCNLAMLTGNIGRPGTGVNPLRLESNTQGACDMGTLPDVYTGYQAVNDPELRGKFEESWGVALPDKKGLVLTEAVSKARQGELKAMYILGDDSRISETDRHHLAESLEKLEFLVVQDTILSETAQLADVVLPAACFAEKEGTFSNTERRVQRVRKALDPPGEAKADWQIISALSTRMGFPMPYSAAEEIFAEICSLTPAYAGITYPRLEGKGLVWPCPDLDHPGTAYLHGGGKFSRGLGLFCLIEAQLPTGELEQRI